ncbi:hypothetical protein Ahy_B05g079253 [Arachis hypogaea]|uniref:BED-type domain-containing protein n=1 Tax=Arachis hypogaea TaxID=3818 RepID=A0A444Z9D4_ARAHY|nr:hypothetical protein Ahy_B05g079253 [Arachis hypogaea]
MMCIYCDKPVRGGGINRFKYHLAGKGDVESITPKEVDALRNDLANMSIQPTLDVFDDQDNYGPSNNAMEDMDANQNEGNIDQAPNLSCEDVDANFELTPWT